MWLRVSFFVIRITDRRRSKEKATHAPRPRIDIRPLKTGNQIIVDPVNEGGIF